MVVSGLDANRRTRKKEQIKKDILKNLIGCEKKKREKKITWVKILKDIRDSRMAQLVTARDLNNRVPSSIPTWTSDLRPPQLD